MTFPPYDVSPNDVSPNDVSPNVVSSNDLSPNDVSPNDVSPNNISLNNIFLHYCFYNALDCSGHCKILHRRRCNSRSYIGLAPGVNFVINAWSIFVKFLWKNWRFSDNFFLPKYVAVIWAKFLPVSHLSMHSVFHGNVYLDRNTATSGSSGTVSWKTSPTNCLWWVLNNVYCLNHFFHAGLFGERSSTKEWTHQPSPPNQTRVKI
jgi:hypothetical protein